CAGDDGHLAGQIEELAGRYIHGGVHGVRITFIRFGSRACSLENQRGPSSSGAMAVISGATLILPLAINSMACGYSPAEAHEPCNRSCRVTTFCSGSVTSG